jgi:hypothetical protein
MNYFAGGMPSALRCASVKCLPIAALAFSIAAFFFFCASACLAAAAF